MTTGPGGWGVRFRTGRRSRTPPTRWPACASPAATSTCAATSPPSSPAENHFRALDAALPGLGVDRSELLHVAQSLFHDHVPAKREGLPSVWINRRHDRAGWGATPEPDEDFSYDLEFKSMADFPDAADQAFAASRC